MDQMPGAADWRRDGWIELTSVLLDSYRDRVGCELIPRAACSDDAPTHDGPTHDGPTHDGPTDDGPTHDGPTDDGPADDARRLFEAPCVVVAHGTQDDPILIYGNRMALELWDVDVETLLSMPSRMTAEPMRREERAELLERAARDGFVDDYRGIRISRTGRRFRIERATIWNLRDGAGQPAGQAATFSQWHFLEN